jgi:parvulin-like peptidyl-prolyl isomerase
VKGIPALGGLACATALFLASCSNPPAARLAARVNGEPITMEQWHLEQRFLEAMHQDASQALDGLIDQALILQEGARLGLRFNGDDRAAAESRAMQGVDPDLLATGLQANGLTRAQWTERLVRAYEADEVVRLAVRNNLEISRQEVQDHYWENITQYRRPERRVLRQIYTRTRSRAESAMRELELGEPFAGVAASQGQGPEAASQGLLGTLARSQLPQSLAKAAWALKAGTFSPIVASHWGYHILYCESLLPAESDSLDDAAPKARASLLLEKEKVFYQAWLARLREGAEIEHLAEPEAPADKPHPVKTKKGRS